MTPVLLEPRITDRRSPRRQEPVAIDRRSRREPIPEDYLTREPSRCGEARRRRIIEYYGELLGAESRRTG